MHTKILYSGLLAVAMLPIASMSDAQSVTLESVDSTISLTGELLSFENDTYRIRSAIGVVELGAAVVNCIGNACPGANIGTAIDDFAIAGSAAINDDLMPTLISAYAERAGMQATSSRRASGASEVAISDQSGGTSAVQIVSNGSNDALDELRERTADIAVSTRQVRQAEERAFSSNGFADIDGDGSENILALDGLMIVTAPTNAVRAITEENIARVFAGQITNWAALGGRNGPIKVYVRDLESGTGSVFYDLMMRPANARFAQNVTVVQTDKELSDAVANDPSAIGFTSFSTVGDASALAIRGECGLQTPANAFTIKTEEYPLTRRLYAYADGGAENETVGNFIDFIGTEAAQSIISDAGFVDLGVSAQSINNQGLRFAASVLPTDAEVSYPQVQSMVQDLITADRLSLTFRFENGSARLDTRGRDDIGRLVELMSGSQLENKEIIIVGYTDSVGAAANNVLLSQERAAQVLSQLVSVLPADRVQSARITSTGYGEMSPLGCNQTENGRRINRRVEVWVRDITTAEG